MRFRTLEMSYQVFEAPARTCISYPYSSDLMSSSSQCLKIFLFIIDGQQFKNNEFRFKGGVIWIWLFGSFAIYIAHHLFYLRFSNMKLWFDIFHCF